MKESKVFTTEDIKNLVESNIMLFDTLHETLVSLCKAKQSAIALDVLKKLISYLGNDKNLPDDIKAELLKEYAEIGTILTYKMIIENGELERKD